MNESLVRWLHLRESADAAARSDRLTRDVVNSLDPRGCVHAIDLATGTGANIRYLVERLARDQHWLAIDRDAGLLGELPALMASWAASRGYDARTNATGCVIRSDRLECRIEARQMDLGTLDDRSIFANRHLVTASALLDLVSSQWLQALADHCHSAHCSALFALTYTGRSACLPADPEDGTVRRLMNRHQKGDKGLGGPAEGPDAAVRAEQIFATAGLRVRREASDWTIGPADADLQRALIQGWAHAAVETDPHLGSTIARWLERRLQHVADGRSHIVVSHDDIGAVRDRVPASTDER